VAHCSSLALCVRSAPQSPHVFLNEFSLSSRTSSLLHFLSPLLHCTAVSSFFHYSTLAADFFSTFCFPISNRFLSSTRSSHYSLHPHQAGPNTLALLCPLDRPVYVCHDSHVIAFLTCCHTYCLACNWSPGTSSLASLVTIYALLAFCARVRFSLASFHISLVPCSSLSKSTLAACPDLFWRSPSINRNVLSLSKSVYAYRPGAASGSWTSPAVDGPSPPTSTSSRGERPLLPSAGRCCWWCLCRNPAPSIAIAVAHVSNSRQNQTAAVERVFDVTL
jgi:hypothetical protein